VTLPDSPARRKPIDRIPLLPLGRLHSAQTCCYCGAGKGEDAELERTILGLTYAEAAVCLNLADCLRRRLRRAA
jgi:hypothetical protein